MNFAGYGTDHKGFGRCKFHGGSTPNHRTQARSQEIAQRLAASGTPMVVDPGAALLSEVHRTAGHIAWLRGEIERQPNISTVESRTFLKHYRQEREHLVRVSKAAIDSGAAEREVRLAEDKGRAIAGMILTVLRGLSLSSDQLSQARRVAALELRRMGESQSEGDGLAPREADSWLAPRG